jgi:hypothetical protein
MSPKEPIAGKNSPHGLHYPLGRVVLYASVVTDVLLCNRSCCHTTRVNPGGILPVNECVYMSVCLSVCWVGGLLVTG